MNLLLDTHIALWAISDAPEAFGPSAGYRLLAIEPEHAIAVETATPLSQFEGLNPLRSSRKLPSLPQGERR